MSDTAPPAIYGLANCDSCRAARKAMPEASFRDVRRDPLSAQERAQLLARFGDALVNRAARSWRALDPETQALDADSLLAAHPVLMKRPAILAAGQAFLGWTAQTRTALRAAGALPPED
ncbi:MAG: arsenate reductase [Rhodobacteraceae bacterium]|nr:arsenate reductase [Paracoccaceae bacterium]